VQKVVCFTNKSLQWLQNFIFKSIHKTASHTSGYKFLTINARLESTEQTA